MLHKFQKKGHRVILTMGSAHYFYDEKLRASVGKYKALVLVPQTEAVLKSLVDFQAFKEIGQQLREIGRDATKALDLFTKQIPFGLGSHEFVQRAKIRYERYTQTKNEEDLKLALADVKRALKTSPNNLDALQLAANLYLFKRGTVLYTSPFDPK